MNILHIWILMEKNTQVFFILNKVNRPIAVIQRYANGLIVHLPVLKFDFDHNKFIGVIRQCAEKFLYKRVQTPPPSWTKLFTLNDEIKFDQKLKALNDEINSLEEKKDNIEKEKQEIIQYKGLLYEQGSELESLVLKSFNFVWI